MNIPLLFLIMFHILPLLENYKTRKKEKKKRILRANPFPKVTDLFSRLPLPYILLFD